MDNNYYQIYTDAVLQLAESIVIKSSDTANAVNNDLLINVGPTAVDLLDPMTWKYYLHVAGEYHITDEIMQVISMDTLEVINFTRDNLSHHRATAKAYIYGSKPYKELVNKYPTQERLIVGILYPSDLATAVNAQDGTILAFPSHLVEDYEYTLMNRLQAWIYSYLVRWDNTQFKLSDNLYATTMLGILYLNLVPAIINFRLASCKTNEAHSYHIRQYLASHGLLDAYLDYLTREQALFLYRNIAYIERNSGKQAVFEWLTEHIMTRRGLPLAAFEMRHDLTGQPENLKPLLAFQKIPLNTDHNYDLIDSFTLSQTMDKEDPLARDNVKYRNDEQLEIAQRMEYSLSNRLGTKLLESSIIDYSGSERYTLADTLLYEWMFLSNRGTYKAFVNVVSPLTGETLSLSVKDAFEFYIYAFCTTIGITLVNLPTVYAKRVSRIPKPSLADVMSVVNPTIVPADFGQQMLDLIPVPMAMISVDSFYEHCTELQHAAMLQWGFVSVEEMSEARGQKHGLISRCWADVGLQLGTQGQTYAAWFADRNIQITDYRTSDLETLTVSLMEAATGTSSSQAITLKDIQQAMIRLMTQLSSYSVQFSSTINSGPILEAGNATIRPDDIDGFQSGQNKIITAVNVIAAKVKQFSGYDYDIGSSTFDEQVDVHLGMKSKFRIRVKPELADNGIGFAYNIPNDVRVTYELPADMANPRNVTQVIGIDQYLALSLDDQMTVPDMWHEH